MVEGGGVEEYIIYKMDLMPCVSRCACCIATRRFLMLDPVLIFIY